MSLIFGKSEYERFYSQYERYSFFSRRASALLDVLGSLRHGRIVIAGCGYGFLNLGLRDLGFEDVWGLDASEYAIQKAVESGVDPDTLILGDVLDEGDGSFDAIVTEDLLPCASDAFEAHDLIVASRTWAPTRIHIVTPLRPRNEQSSDLLWLPIKEWRDMAPLDLVLGTDEI